MDFSQQGLMGALAQLAQAQQQGTQRADAAYGALAGHLQEPMDRSGALMRMAQGFMSPTRTGGFAESAGLAIGGYADARDRMQDMDLARRKKLAEIEAARARLGMEGAQNQFNIHKTGHGLQQEAEQQRINSLIHGGGAAAIPADGAMTLNDVAPSGMGVPNLSSSGFDAPVIRPGADMPAQGASPTGDLIPPVNEGSFFIPPGDTGQTRRIRQSEADMFGMPEGMDQRPAPGYSPFDDAGMMGTLPPPLPPPRPHDAANRAAPSAGEQQLAQAQAQSRQADMQVQARGDGLPMEVNQIGEPSSPLSPDMAMTPEQGRRFEGQPQARQAPAQGRQPQQAPQLTGADAVFARAEQQRAHLERLAAQEPGIRANPTWQEAMKQADDVLLKGDTSLIREYRAYQQQDPNWRQNAPTLLDFDMLRKRAGATQINMPGQERSFSSAAGTGVAERVFTALDDAQTQQSRLADYERIGQLLNDPDVYTGTAGAAINNLKRLGSTLLGLDLEGVSNADAAERIRTSLFAGFRQEMLRGATSNADREFIRAIPPNVGDSDEGIRLTIELQRRAANAARERAAILSEMVERAPDGNLTLRDWTEYQRRAAEIDAFNPEDLDRAMRISRQNASQSGPLAGIPPSLMSGLSQEVQSLAFDNALTRNEIIQIMINEGMIDESKAVELREAPQ